MPRVAAELPTTERLALGSFQLLPPSELPVWVERTVAPNVPLEQVRPFEQAEPIEQDGPVAPDESVAADGCVAAVGFGDDAVAGDDQSVQTAAAAHQQFDFRTPPPGPTLPGPPLSQVAGN